MRVPTPYRLILYLCCLFFKTARSQSFHPVFDLAPQDKYAPVNKLVKKNGIRSITDSSEFIRPSGMRVKYYDEQGRLIREGSQAGDSIRPPYVYRYNGDTIYRLHYAVNDTVLLSFQRFVINARGQLISYLDCRNDHLQPNSFHFGYEIFLYNDKQLLIHHAKYGRDDYPGKLSLDILINEDALSLTDLVQYRYLPARKGIRCIVGEHVSNQPEEKATDSIYLDKQNRMIRQVNIQSRGVMGEQVYNDLRHIITREYRGDTVISHFEYNYCRAAVAGEGCLDRVVLDKEKEEVIYHLNGMQRVVYGFYASGERYVVDRFYYK